MFPHPQQLRPLTPCAAAPLHRRGMSERLMMTVAVPFLWGVPPELETVCNAVVMGGGIVEKVSQEWGIYHVN